MILSDLFSYIAGTLFRELLKQIIIVNSISKGEVIYISLLILIIKLIIQPGVAFFNFFLLI